MEEYNIDYFFNEVASKTIKRYREQKGYSLEEVVKKMKNPISRQSLFKYENNLARMKNNIFIDICQALDIDPSEVFNEINRKTFDITFSSRDLPRPFNFPIIDENGFVTYGQIGFDNTGDKIDEESLFKLNEEHLRYDEESTKNLMDKYKLLFDKDERLTQEQKEFFMDMIETQHRKFDEAQEKGNVN